MDEEEKAYYVCLETGCNSACRDYYGLVNHYRKHKKRTPSRADCGRDELPDGFQLLGTAKAPPDPPEALDPSFDGKDEVVTASYKEAPEPNVILRKLLTTYPGLTEGHVNEIMSWADMEGSLHPMQVEHLLGALALVPKGAEKIIPQKYALALQKAAAEGKADVQMVVGRWQMQGWPQLAGQQGSMFGMGYQGMPPGMGLPGFGQPFLNSGMPGFPNWYDPRALGVAGFGPMGTTQPTSEASPEDKARDERVERLEATQNQVLETLNQMIQRLTESEEEKKAAALNARLTTIESSILSLANAPKQDEEQSPMVQKLLDELKETRSDVARMREEQLANQIKGLQEHITSLESIVKQGQSNELARMQDELNATKESLKDAISKLDQPKIGQNEFDVLSKAVDKASETVQDIGKTARAVVMGRRNADAFDPNRISAEEREQTGSAIASHVESEARLKTVEQTFLGSG